MNRAATRRLRFTSGLREETDRLGALLQRYLAFQLNRLFELTRAGGRRRRIRILMAALVFAVVSFGLHVLVRAQFGLEATAEAGLNRLLSDGFIAGFRILLIFGIAASVGLDAAGRFLSDVFELKDPRVAWRYIAGLAAGTGEEVLHLREGRASDTDKNSTILHIGGPGRVFVDFDTAALFERPDGSPHVVGAADETVADQDAGLTGFELEGFERLRAPIINLRDQYIGNPSGEPLTVIGRSQDGMPISVTDVRGVFSLRREPRAGATTKGIERAFPFRARDVENLIYKQAVQVLTSGEHASGLPEDWTSTMHVLLRESLREYMSQNPLAEFLAGVGALESESSEFRNDTILSRALEVSSDIPGSIMPRPSSMPRFRPRTELSGKFKKYGSEFSTKAEQHGLELHWIGVGTWKMPDAASEAAMSEKHVEAWRLNRDNASRSDPKALERISEESLLEQKLRLIQDVPSRSHQKNRARYSEKSVLLECLLQDFWEQIGNALDIHYRRGSPPTDLQQLEKAVLEIERLLRISQVGQVIGGGTLSRVRNSVDWQVSKDAPPAPASREEAQRYQALLSKLKGDYRVAEAMIANEGRRHGGLTREQLITRIVERFERHGH